MNGDDRVTVQRVDPIPPPPMAQSHYPPRGHTMYTGRPAKPDTVARNVSIVLGIIASLGGGSIYYVRASPPPPPPAPVRAEPIKSTVESTAIVLIKHRLDGMGERLDKIEERSSEHHDLLIRIDAKLPRRR